MKHLPFISNIWSNIWNAVSAPTIPARSLSITESSLVLITLRQRRGEFEPRQAGILPLPSGLVTASFDRPNISDEGRMAEALNRVMAQADIRKMGPLNVTLPAGSAKSMIVSLESVPANKLEMTQLLEWKIERATGFRIDELRSSHHRLENDGTHLAGPHWLVSVVHNSVIDQYESIFRQLDWKVGLIVPQHIGEVNWLLRPGNVQSDSDQLLVSLNPRGFEVVIVRGNTPIMIREVECPTDEIENEFYRLMIYYRDKLTTIGRIPNLSRVLTIGTIADQQRFRDLVSGTLERSVISLNAGQLGLNLDPGMSLSQVAAAAGLAVMAW